MSIIAHITLPTLNCEFFKNMDCHYSCSSCTGSTYLDLCSSCAPNRQLYGSSCECSQGYYEWQQSSCINAQQSNPSSFKMMSTALVFYYISVVLCWLCILCNLCRLYNHRLKKLVDFCQLVGLLIEYRYRFASSTYTSLSVFAAYNFNFMTEVVCTKVGSPYKCEFYENLVGPLITTVIFVGLMVVMCCYLIRLLKKRELEDRCSQKSYQNEGDEQQQGCLAKYDLKKYWYKLYPTILMVYLDYTLIHISIALTKIIVLSGYTSFIVLPFLLLVLYGLRLQFKIINHPKQFSLNYRSKHGYFFIYDQHYHSNYIDYLYLQQQRQRKGQRFQPFYPHSNLIIVETVYKLIMAVCTVGLYEYRPNVLAIVLTLLLLIQFFNLGVFQIYQLTDFVIYIGMATFYLMFLMTYWQNVFFQAFVLIFGILSQVAIGYCLIQIGISWNAQKESLLLLSLLDEEEQEEEEEEELTQEAFSKSKRHGTPEISINNHTMESGSLRKIINSKIQLYSRKVIQNPLTTKKLLKSSKKIMTHTIQNDDQGSAQPLSKGSQPFSNKLQQQFSKKSKQQFSKRSDGSQEALSKVSSAQPVSKGSSSRPQSRATSILDSRNQNKKVAAKQPSICGHLGYEKDSRLRNSHLPSIMEQSRDPREEAQDWSDYSIPQNPLQSRLTPSKPKESLRPEQLSNSQPIQQKQSSRQEQSLQSQVFQQDEQQKPVQKQEAPSFYCRKRVKQPFRRPMMEEPKKDDAAQ